MSTQLTKARSGLAQIPGYMKQDKVLMAAIAMQDALTTMLKEALMKAEKEEFVEMVYKAVSAMANNKEFKTLYPLQFTYEPGKERDLLNAIKELLQALNEQQASLAQDRLAELEKQKKAALAKGQEYLDGNERDKAKAHFARVTKEFSDLKGDAGEMFLKAEMYEEAIEYLGQALEDSPDALHLYNRIGIALRKVGRFETAEKYYRKALGFKKDDPNLYFNMGRLYFEWKKWKRMEKVAALALKYRPDFEQAQKMMDFAKKKLAAVPAE
jgi:tetratricopeptide (TPR) repeat protein